MSRDFVWMSDGGDLGDSDGLSNHSGNSSNHLMPPLGRLRHVLRPRHQIDAHFIHRRYLCKAREREVDDGMERL